MNEQMESPPGSGASGPSRAERALITPPEALALLEREPGNVVFIDIREIDEFKAARLSGPAAGAVRLLPLSVLPFLPEPEDTRKTAIFFCRSGRRTADNFERLEKLGYARSLILDKGLNGWQEAGLPAEFTRQAIPLYRQVQIGVGLVIVLFSLLGLRFGWATWLNLLVGAGLTTAGLTGFCSLAQLLSRMPWNREKP